LSVIRDKARRIYDYISGELYFNLPDMEVKGEKYNSALLLSVFTGLNEGKALLIGEPGLGKTTSAEYVASLFYRLPLDVVMGSEVSGHPEQTEEKMVGGPDLGELNKGNVRVIWSDFTQLPIKIVDEINRLPEQKQNIILNGVDRGVWHYLDEVLINNEHSLFATANYQDRGTNTITRPLRDRFDIMVESKHPGATLATMVTKKKDAHLKNEPIARKMWASLKEMEKDYSARLDGLEKLSDEYSDYLKSNGIEAFSKNERVLARDEINSLEFDEDAETLVRCMISELSFGCSHGQKRSNEACSEGDKCRYVNYLPHQIINCASNRLPKSIYKYSKTLAWFLGDDEVTAEHVKLAAPYALAPRFEWKDSYVSKHEKDERNDSIHIHLAKRAVEEVATRYEEQAHEIKQAMVAARKFIETNGDEVEIDTQDKAKKTLKFDDFIKNLDEQNHPIYVDIKNNVKAFR